MSRFGLNVAKTFGQKLPGFTNPAEAEAHLFSERDKRLRRIAELAAASGEFVADLTPMSLKSLEHWYFTLWESDSFLSLEVTREEFERCMAMYFGAVVVRNCPGAAWVVQEYAFERGSYELGLQRGLFCMMRSRFTDHFKEPSNKRREKIYRDYQKYFGT